MKTPLIKKSTTIGWIVFIILLLSLVEFFYFHLVLNIILLVLSLLLIFVLYGSNKTAKLFGFLFIKKDSCPYYVVADCPYGMKEQCPYDTTFCLNFKESKHTKWHTIIVFLLLIMSIAISVVSVLIEAGGDDIIGFISNNCDYKLWIKIIAPVTNSVIAAILCAIVMDIPSRMMEYQEYFIRLLSSSDYLKVMDEEDLLKLRKKVTWQLHIKDVPRMPKGLIEMDEKILEMLKRPYFKVYNQTMSIEASEKPEMLKKTVRIDYTAFNPYSNKHPIQMDLGIANSLQFKNKANKDEAKNLFELKQFDVAIDNEKDIISILPGIKVNVVAKPEEGLLYNGKVMLVPKDDDKDFNLDIDSIKNNKTPSDICYNDSSNSENALMITFFDKIRVNIEYIVHVPKSDVCYTKRLRYPVKYFHLDYTLNEKLDYTLVGQLLGTLIDQPDVTTEVSDNQKHICMRTNNWLLPKNGVIIVHCKA